MIFLLFGSAAAVVGAAVWARRSFRVIEVTGRSMLPTYRPGDRVLVRRRPGRVPPRGAVVVFRAPPGLDVDWYVKRVAATPGDPVPPEMRAAVPTDEVVPPGRLLVLGDNPHSVDSRLIGYVRAESVLGTAIRALAPVAHYLDSR